MYMKRLYVECPLFTYLKSSPRMQLPTNPFPPRAIFSYTHASYILCDMIIILFDSFVCSSRKNILDRSTICIFIYRPSKSTKASTLMEKREKGVTFT